MNSGKFVILLWVCLRPLAVSQAHAPIQWQCRIDPKLPDIYKWYPSSSAARGRIYAIVSERKSKILKNYSKLRLGMNPKEVQELLGPADYEEAGLRNSGYRPDGTRDLQDRCAAEWGYYFKKTGENLADMRDSVLIVEFNSGKKLTWVAPQNIPRLSPIGSPIN